MIITLVKADFSARNIGTLGSFSILTNILNANYNGPTSVMKGDALSATVTLFDNYEVDSVKVTMNGVEMSDAYTIEGKVISINIATVTGVVFINVVDRISVSDKIFSSWTPVLGTRVGTSMITSEGKAHSDRGVVYDFTGYDWSQYKIRVTCRYGTNTSMYAGGFYDGNGNFLGGFWKSSGTASIFNNVELNDIDLPVGVSWSDIAVISLCATEMADSPLQAPILEIVSPEYYVPSALYPEGVVVSKVFPGATQYETSTSGMVTEYSGYDWENYDIYATCRYGTNTAMYAIALWGENDTYLGGVWLSAGAAQVFTLQQINDSDLPEGVTWANVEKIGLAHNSSVTPALRLVPKV